MRLDKGYYGGPVGDTEFSWGPGPCPPGKEHAPPSEGGVYRGRSPDMTVPRRKWKPGDRVPGYPGEQIAR
jgi:hypothetical protein